MSETVEADSSPSGSSSGSPWLYMILAVVLIAVIIVVGAVLIKTVLPGLKDSQQPTVAPTPTLALTFTPASTSAPTSTPPALAMRDTDTPRFDFESAGARPGEEWTGFFGQVLDAQGEPVAGVGVVVWYRNGTLASEVAHTDESGCYEIRLAEAPLEGSWSIQLLTDDRQPASKLFTFNTDDDVTTGIQQIQVIWKEIP